MLPEALLRYSVRGLQVHPHFLAEHDVPWLRALLDAVDRYVGRPQRELAERLREPRQPGVPAGKHQLAAHVLLGLVDTRKHAAIPAVTARAAVFAAASTAGDRAAVLSSVAATLGIAVRELETSLFADLPGERMVMALEPSLSPHELMLRVNLALAQGMLFRATSLQLQVQGNARVLVRHAKLRGLICSLRARSAPDEAILDISGPLALFHRTLVYGRALGELLPLCAWCRHFCLLATVELRGQRLELEITSADRILPATEPRRFDSQVEERFAREFSRLAPEWEVIREPEPIFGARTLIFPDFALHHRDAPERRWMVEIVGFWTPDYLGRKLADYRAAGLTNLILCIDRDRDCGADDLPTGAHVVRYHRRVDAAAVLAILESCRATGANTRA